MFNMKNIPKEILQLLI